MCVHNDIEADLLDLSDSQIFMCLHKHFCFCVCARTRSRVSSELGIWVFETIYSRDARHFEYISLQLGSHSGLGTDDATVLYLFIYLFFLDFDFFTCGSRVPSTRNNVV